MEEYIKKNPILTEIDRLQETTMDKNQNFLSSYHEGIFDGLSMIEKFLDTLEVKDVNLDDEKDAYICNHFSEGSDGGMISDAYREIGGVTYFDLSNIAEHFFELGMQQSKNDNNNEG